MSVQHEAGVINDGELKTRYGTLAEERRHAEHSLAELEALRGQGEDAPFSSWLDEANVTACMDALFAFADLRSASREHTASGVEALHTLADELGLRVAVRHDGGLGIQFSIPQHMRIPTDKGAGQLQVDSDQILSPTP